MIFQDSNPFCLVGESHDMGGSIEDLASREMSHDSLVLFYIPRRECHCVTCICKRSGPGSGSGRGCCVLMIWSLGRTHMGRLVKGLRPQVPLKPQPGPHYLEEEHWARYPERYRCQSKLNSACSRLCQRPSLAQVLPSCPPETLDFRAWLLAGGLSPGAQKQLYSAWWPGALWNEHFGSSLQPSIHALQSSYSLSGNSPFLSYFVTLLPGISCGQRAL